MENTVKSISTDLFYKIRSRFTGLRLGEAAGEITINPEDAVFFDFDYMEGEVPLGHVSISLAEPTSLKVYYSSGITENMSTFQKSNWYGFLRELREFAKRRLMNFDTRDIAKDHLDKRDFAFLSQYSKNQQDSGEAKMNESMYGTSKTSYQKLLDTKLIIKHKKQVDETVPGSRARNISALFVENQDGERFKYPFIHLSGARAMQRHVANGGVPYDEFGQHIVSMSEQLAQLKSFDTYVVRNDLLNSDTNSIVERSKSELQRIREEIARLSKQQYYLQAKENFQSQTAIEVPSDVVEELTNKFTVKNFKEDIKSVFPLIYKFMQEESKENVIGYDDIVEMTVEESVNDEAEIVEDNELDTFDSFESWVLNLGETSAIQSVDKDEQQQAIAALNELTKEHFPAGVDGENAIRSLQNIIDDPALSREIKNAATEDADTCVRPLIKQWLEKNAPEVLDEVDFGDMEEAVDPKNPRDYEKPAYMRKAAGEKPLTTKDIDDKDNESPTTKAGLAKRTQQLNMQEVAEFISSFYDRESRTFPKGPEGVVTMVGKKFGEQAETLARKFVEDLTPHQDTGNPLEQSVPVEEESSGYYYERLAQEVFDENPNLDTSGRDPEVLNAVFPLLVRDLGSRKKANSLLNYDEDFAADFVSAYGELKRSSESNESSTMELEAFRRLSGISQGMGF
jgi:hypothetical protein